jgi:large subunit ribosomal protein L7/L12
LEPSRDDLGSPDTPAHRVYQDWLEENAPTRAQCLRADATCWTEGAASAGQLLAAHFDDDGAWQERVLCRYDVVLEGPGPRPILVIKVLRELLDLGLRDARAFIDRPTSVVSGWLGAHAWAVQRHLQAVGATVVTRPTTTEREGWTPRRPGWWIWIDGPEREVGPYDRRDAIRLACLARLEGRQVRPAGLRREAREDIDAW